MHELRPDGFGLTLARESLISAVIMKPSLCCLVILIVVCFSEVACAQEARPQPVIGKLVLLRNGRVMEGEIEKIDKQICIRNGMSEIMISTEKALKICADWDEVYAEVQALLKQEDAGDCIKFARWCLRNGRDEKALEQARKALALQPAHPEARPLIVMLERALLESRKSKPAVTVSPAVAIRPVETRTRVDVTTETLVGFVNRVQPILMNACANCHATGRGGNFLLERVLNASQKTSTEKNLSVVLGNIDFEHPSTSPMLLKAVMKHGNALQAPLKDGNTKAFQTLQEWIVQTIVRNPHLKEEQAVTKAPQAPDPRRLSATVKGVAVPLTTPNAGILVNEVVLPKGPLVPKASSLDPMRNILVPNASPPGILPASVMQTPPSLPLDDPHDPDIFNRQYHPSR